MEPCRGADRFGGFERDACERLEVISDPGVASFDFKHRKRGLGSLSRAFLLDLEDRRHGLAAALEGQSYIGGFIADRHRIEVRGARYRQRDRGIYHRAYHPLGGNMDEKIFQPDRSPPFRKMCSRGSGITSKDHT